VADSQSNRLQDNLDSMKNLRENLREYGLDLDSIPCVIQYNKRDLPNALPVAELEARLNPDKRFVQFEAIATEGIGVRETLREIASQVLKKLNETANIVTDEEIVGERLGVLPPVEEEEKPASSSKLKAASQGGPQIEYEQTSRWSWRGIPIGEGEVSIHTVTQKDGSVNYELRANYRVLLRKRQLNRTLKFIGEDRREILGDTHTYYFLRDTATSRDTVPVTVYVEKGTIPRIYMIYPGIAGDIKVGPSGEFNPF